MCFPVAAFIAVTTYSVELGAAKDALCTGSCFGHTTGADGAEVDKGGTDTYLHSNLSFVIRHP